MSTAEHAPDLVGYIEAVTEARPVDDELSFATRAGRTYLRWIANDVAHHRGRYTPSDPQMNLYYLLSSTIVGAEYETHGQALYNDMQRAKYYRPMPRIRVSSLLTKQKSFQGTLDYWVKAHNLPHDPGTHCWNIGTIIGLGIRKEPLPVNQVMDRFRAMAAMSENR